MYKEATPYYFQIDSHRLRCLETLLWLGIHPDEHRHVGRDIAKAYAMTSLFFEGGDGFFQSEKGIQFKDTLVLNHMERHKTPPNVRGYMSSYHRPKAFFAELAALDLFDEDLVSEDIKERVPTEWDVVMRPLVARCKLSQGSLATLVH